MNSYKCVYQRTLNNSFIKVVEFQKVGLTLKTKQTN